MQEKHLRGISWAVNADLPERVISQLEKQWPSVKLIVSEYDRMGTDTRILSSPLLHELTFGINNWKSGYEVQEQYSRLPKLREVLLESPQLKKLDIRTQYSWLQRGIWPGHTTTFETRPRLLNLPLQPSDRLPSLDELRFSGRDIYELDLEHCQLLKQCMNWSQLRTLDLGLSCPQHFFEEIGDKLVSLKSLGMGITTGDRKYLYWKYGPMTCNYNHYEPVRQFLRCVSGLYELRITDLATAARLIVADLLDSQESLRTLSFHSSMRRRYRQKHKPHAWKMTQLDELRHRAPDLEDLEIDFPLEEIEIPLEDGKWVSHSRTIARIFTAKPSPKPSHFASTMARFNNLRRLKIFVELNEAASDFAGEYRQDAQGSVPTPPFNEKLGREVTTSLFRSFFENDAYARLTELEVSFTHVKVYDRGQHEDIEFPIKVRRLERDDAPSPLDGGFTVECQGKWLRGR